MLHVALNADCFVLACTLYSSTAVEMDQLAQRMNQSWPLFQEYYYHANHDDVSNIPK